MSELGQLRQLLSVYFDESELKSLTFDLGLDYEMLPGPTKGDKARELVAAMWRGGRLEELVGYGRQLRPNVDWPDLAAAPVPGAPPPSPRPPQASPATTPSAVAPPSAVANPFTYGNPISDPDRFFGRSREVEQVFNRLRNAEGESSSIVGGRRIGKSSLLNYIANPDVRRQYGMDPAHSTFVYVDLQMVDNQTTPARLWQRLLSQMNRECRDEELAARLEQLIAAASFDNFSLADLFDVVDAKGRHIVFLLDEFENVTSNPNFDPGFFYGLRSLAIQHSLSLVTSSRHELIELTHSQAVRSSPFFNIFANINVRLFSEAEVARLVNASLDGTGVEFTEEELVTLAEIAGGHPFFLQAAGHFLFDAHADYAQAGRRQEAWLRAFHAEVGPHLAHFWRTTDQPGQVTLMLLALLSRREGGRPTFEAAALEQYYPRAGQNLAKLVRLGYVAETGGRYALFSSAYRDWIAAELRSSGESPAGQTAAEPARDSLSKMPTDRKKALAATSERVVPGYRPLLVALIEQAGDLAQTVTLIREGLA